MKTHVFENLQFVSSLLVSCYQPKIWSRFKGMPSEPRSRYQRPYMFSKAIWVIDVIRYLHSEASKGYVIMLVQVDTFLDRIFFVDVGELFDVIGLLISRTLSESINKTKLGFT